MGEHSWHTRHCLEGPTVTLRGVQPGRCHVATHFSLMMQRRRLRCFRIVLSIRCLLVLKLLLLISVSVCDVGHFGPSDVWCPVAAGGENFLSVQLGLSLEIARVALLHEVLLDRFAVELGVVGRFLDRVCICHELGLECADLLLSLVQLLGSSLKLY